jgi:hypothetical protein
MQLSKNHTNVISSRSEMKERLLKGRNEFLTKNSAKTWQKLWDLGVMIAISIASLTKKPVSPVMIDLLEGFLTH